MSEKKTIFIATYTGRDTRDILRTDVFNVLKSEEVDIVILSPAASEHYFQEEFSDSNVYLEVLHPPKRLEQIYLMLMNMLFANAKFSRTMEIKYQHFRHKGFRGSYMALSYLFRGLSSRIISYKNYSARNFLKKLNTKIFPDRIYKKVFEKYKPSLVFTAHTFYLGADSPILKRAISDGIPAVTMVPSWDNITTRGEMPVVVDKLVVWNKKVKREVIELHGYDSKDIYVSGPPQFDIYFRRHEIPTREEFFTKMGLDPKRRLITYTTGTSYLFPEEPEVVKILYECIKKDKLSYPSQLLIRLNPRDNIERYKDFIGKPYVIVDNSWRRSNVFIDNWDPSKEDIIHLASTMCHSDVVLNVASTITIDACCANTPVVNIGFDGHKTKPYINSVLRYYDYDHYQSIIKSDGVRLARSAKEMIDSINTYLEDPSLDEKGRAMIVREQCEYTDGKSGERIAKYLLKLLNNYNI